MALHKGPMLAFDTETTGVNTETDLIVQAALVWIKPGQPLDQWSWIADHGVEIPAAAAAIHGITTERAADEGGDPAEILDTVTGDLAHGVTAGWPIVGMNVVYDLTILDRGCRRLGVPTLGERLGGDHLIRPVVDVYVLDKYIEPYRKGSRKLVDLCARYQVDITGAHQATGDALAAARVAYRIGQLSGRTPAWLTDVWRLKEPDAQRLSALGVLSLGELHDLQMEAKAEQAASFRDYLKRKRGRPDAEVRGEWPIVPHVAEAMSARSRRSGTTR